MEETDRGVLLRSALRIEDIDQLYLPRCGRMSVMWVDLSERPDLTVLAIHRVPEPGDAMCTWVYGNPGTRKMIVGLRIAMEQPTTAVFTLAFPVERFAGHLLTIAKYGKIWIVPGPPLAHPVGMQDMDALTFLTHIVTYSGQGVLLELEAHLVTALRVQLDEWKRLILPGHARIP